MAVWPQFPRTELFSDAQASTGTTPGGSLPSAGLRAAGALSQIYKQRTDKKSGWIAPPRTEALQRGSSPQPAHIGGPLVLPFSLRACAPRFRSARGATTTVKKRVTREIQQGFTSATLKRDLLNSADIVRRILRPEVARCAGCGTSRRRRTPSWRISRWRSRWRCSCRASTWTWRRSCASSTAARWCAAAAQCELHNYLINCFFRNLNKGGS